MIKGQRITLNIRGCKFETYEETLCQYPDTLLGCPEKRSAFYDPYTKEYRLDTDRSAFDAILFYYQSRGILSRPETVPADVFDQELVFYELKQKEEVEIELIDEEVLPTRPWQRKAWKFLEYPESSKQAEWYARLCVLIIVISIITFCTETLYISMNSVSGIHSNDTKNSLTAVGGDEELGKIKREQFWFVVDTVIVIWFTGEYLARVAIAPYKYKFVSSALGVIDLLAIIPYFILLGVGSSYYNQDISFAVLRVFRVLRVMRLLKLTRYVSALRILGITVKSCKDQLTALLLLIFISVLAFSSTIYYAEHVENREQFYSIIAACWYTVITMTTVGYGDMAPVTPEGKVIGSFCAVFGIVIMVCLPTPVFILHFNEIYCRHSKRGSPSRVPINDELPLVQWDISLSNVRK